MRIIVVGTGGVGGYFGGQLALAGHDVVFIARGRQLQALNERGLRVESDHAPVTLTEVQATDDVTAAGNADLAIVAVKLWDTEDIARQLTTLAAGGAAVLSLQNGVQKDEELARHLPSESIIGGACYISASIESPGVVRHNGTLARIIMGEYDGRSTDRLRAIGDAFAGAGIDAEISDDIAAVLWRKFVFLVGLSSVTSATRQPIGVLRAVPATRELLHEVMAEVVAVARARGVRLSADYAAQQVAFCDTLPEQMGSSMLHDLLHGRRLELPWLGGAVVEMGELAAVPTPANRILAAALSPYVQGSPGAPD